MTSSGVPGWLSAARARHRARSASARRLTLAGGWLAGGVGVLLLVPLPEVGFPSLLLGLRLLALEHDWAARAYAPVAQAWAWLKGLPIVAKVAIGLATIAVVAVLVWWLA
ncbi:MAG: hypothetical protein RMM28_02320 [Thermoleophilia bacterium]|nr:hypothetical protein [Gaiellaceae bacterium]MDW8337957.1 hypothetical protein [Thermoleophilia bacterium]